MLRDHGLGKMPEAPNFKKILGPSFILLGLGLGSGEIILWPYLTSNFGMGIIWAAVLGITLQFFINMEIERYSLVRGESIFVGFARKIKLSPYWFILSTLAGFVWPGIVASSAKLIGTAIGLKETNYLAIFLLIFMGIILTAGPILYKTVEKFSMVLIAFGVPAILFLVFYVTRNSDFIAFLEGLIGIGKLPAGEMTYHFLPVGLPVASFLAAFAFSGAGGNLNLAQSFYIKEKGYGMGKYSGRITSVLTGEVENIELEGTKFKMSQDNLGRFERWWKLINFEHFLVFWLTGAFTICLLSLLAFSTAFGHVTPNAGISFVLYEAHAISQIALPIIGLIFLLVAGLMLFSTQMTVLDATSRIIAENVLILEHHIWKPKDLSKIYYIFLWIQILFGCVIFLTKFNEPLVLLTIEAVINAAAMFVHIGLTLYLNLVSLEKEVQPSLPRIVIMIGSFLFFGFFTLKTILSYI